MKRSLLIFFCFIALVVICFWYQYKQLFAFPTHIHAWSLTDRYAISLGFINNGFDFFHPETFVMNHQFPGEFRIPANQTITPVDFPFNEFVVAIFMKLSHLKHIAVYRIFILCYSLLGFWFLYKICYLKLKSNVLSFFVLLFCLSSPVYMYYQSGTIPTITGISNVFIGLFFYLKYKNEQKEKLLPVSILFFTIAALARTPFVIFLLSISIVEILPGLFSRAFKVKSFLYFFISGSIVVGYYIYNAHLGKVYGSIYLNYIMPAENWEHAKEIFDSIYHKWLFQYFSGFHYIVLGTLVILYLIAFFKKRILPKKAENILPLFILSSLVLSIVYAVLMFWQFQNHDYYFLDTFFIPIVLVVILCLSEARLFAREMKWIKILLPISLLLFIPFMFSAAFQIQSERRSDEGDVSKIAVREYAGAERFLEQNHVSKEAKILVLGSPAPNMPFIFMNRKGFVVMDPIKEKISESLSWNFDYVVIQKSNLDVVKANYPGIEAKLEKLSANGLINLYKKR